MRLHNYTLIEPAVLDFGSAIVDSTVKKTIAIKNFSQKYISVMMEVRKFDLEYMYGTLKLGEVGSIESLIEPIRKLALYIM